MFCHNCGKEVHGGLKFCPHCGKEQHLLDDIKVNDRIDKSNGNTTAASDDEGKEAVQDLTNSVQQLAKDNRNSSFLKKNNGRNAKILFILLLCILSSAITFKFAGVNSSEPSGDKLQSSGKNTQDLVEPSNKEREQPKQPKEQERANSGTASQVTPNNENEVYVGTYDSGLKAYVLADTLIMNNFRNFSVTVKAVENNNNIIYVSYRFSGSAGNPYRWENSQGYSGTLDHNKPSVENNIYTYFANRWSEHVKKK